MRIDKDSYGSLALVYVLSVAAALPFWLWIKTPWIVWPWTAALLWFCVWQTAFFRIPCRKRDCPEGGVSSVVDGKVVFVGKVVESEHWHRECWQVSVYMNFFDVHANFWPLSGDVEFFKHIQGEHLLAFEPKASIKNEHTIICLKDAKGREIMFKQIAGGFARRIVCYAASCLKAVAGQQCGIIKFGSRIDLYLPLEAKILVKEGDILRACESVVAMLD